MFLPTKPRAYASANACAEALCAERELAAEVDERVVRLDRVRRDDDPFDELVGIALDEHVVFEGGRLAFVAVHREVAREDVLGQERPLLTGAEPRAAASAQAGVHDLLDDVFGRLVEQRVERRVRAVRERRRRCVHESSG